MAKFNARVVSLLLFTRQLQALVQSGTNLLTCAEVMAQEAPPPYDAFSVEMTAKLLEGKTLTEICAAYPELFGRFYVAMIRIGEVGGVLDELLAYLSELLREQTEFAHALAVAGDKPPVPLHGTLDDMLIMLFFCRGLSMLLTLGMPLPLSLELAAETLPQARQPEEPSILLGVTARQATATPIGDRAAVLALLRDAPADEVLSRLATSGLLTPLAAQLLKIGLHTGEIDYAMAKAADLYHDELSTLLGINVSAPGRASKVLNNEGVRYMEEEG